MNTTLKNKCPKCNGTGFALNHREIGRLAKRARTELDLTLAQVARVMCISRQHLHDLEHGKRHWNKDSIKQSQRALKFLALHSRLHTSLSLSPVLPESRPLKMKALHDPNSHFNRPDLSEGHTHRLRSRRTQKTMAAQKQ